MKIGAGRVIIKTDILEIVDQKFMQNIQDFFAKTMDVALLSVYENNWLTDPSNNSDFCRKYTKRSKLGYNRCNKCHQEWEKTAIKEGKPVICRCHVGLTNFAVPVTLEGKYVGSVIGGQVLTEQPDENHFRQTAKDLRINENDYIKEMDNITILSEEKVKAVTELLYLVTNSIVAIAYANSQLKKIGLNYKMPRNIAVEEWFFSNYGKVKRPISSREFEVLKLIVSGKNNAEIAKELFISVHTAKAHVSSILEKFEVEDRVQAAVKAVREGII